MNTVLKLVTEAQEETLFLLWDEYQESFTKNCVINAAVEAIKHRHQAKRKHVTKDEAKVCVEYALYGTLVDGEPGVFGGIGQMIDVAYSAKQRAKTPEEHNHFEKKWKLLRGINFALEDCIRD